jgi:hypothetical protein
MSREGADHTLGRRRDEKARIASALLDLENHPGHKLLNGARLSGETRRRWDDTQSRITALWRTFDSYGRVLDRAERLRGRQPRLGQAELEELTWLLTGPSAELPSQENRRTRRAPSGEWLTLEEVVDRMTTTFKEAAAMVSAADAAWSVLLPRLEEVEQSWRSVRGLLTSLGTPHRDRDGIGRRLAEVRKAVLADPLSLVHDGRTDTTGIDRLHADLTARRGELADVARIRQEELRGRLEAQRVRAERLGHAGNAELVRLRRQARELLGATPCDLPRATAAVAGYEQAVGELRSAAESD